METENKKKFNYGLFAVCVFAVVAVVLVVITVFTFKSKYIAFDSEKVATNYTDSIIQTGDGYNAYKYTLVSKSEKYGDFIREEYIYPIVYPGYSSDLSDDEKDELKDEGGLAKDENKSDATLNDDGTLAGQLADEMYDYYVELVTAYGWDNYDVIFTDSFERLVEVRQQIFGDTFLDDEVMFTALEANVSTYGDSLTGTELELADDEKTIVQEELTGVYELAFGDDYQITCNVVSSTAVEDVSAYTAALDSATLETYGITADDISAVEEVTVECVLQDGTVIATQTVYEVKIGNTWYVDNLTTNTFDLYFVA